MAARIHDSGGERSADSRARAGDPGFGLNPRLEVGGNLDPIVHPAGDIESDLHGKFGEGSRQEPGPARIRISGFVGSLLQLETSWNFFLKAIGSQMPGNGSWVPPVPITTIVP